MADYYRQCPHCGGQTKEHTCEICGRKTMLTNQQYDETEQQDSSAAVMDSVSDKKHTHTPLGHIQSMMAEGKDYGKSKKPNRGTESSKTIRILAVLFIILPFLLILASQDTSEQASYDSEYEEDDNPYYEFDRQYAYLEDYLVTVQSSAPLSCEIDETESEWFYVYNPTPYLYDADIELTTNMGIDHTGIYYGTPYGYESSYSEYPVKECNINEAEFTDLNLFKTDIIYELDYDDNYDRLLIIKQSITEEELETLLKRIYCINILTFYDYDEIMHVMINDELAYNVIYEYEIGDISMTNMDTGKTTHISIDI